MVGYKLHLIRHGITRGNLRGLYQGSGTDLPLCPRGKEQLLRLKSKFTYPKVDKIYVSPLRRAYQTADILYPDMDYVFVSDLRECNFGEFEGKTFDELIKTNVDFPRWFDPGSGFQPPGGESSKDFTERCVSALDSMFTDMMTKGIHEARAITHGGVILTMMAAVAIPRKEPREWSSDNGCGFTLSATVGMWTRDKVARADNIVPYGYDFSESSFNKFRKQ